MRVTGFVVAAWLTLPVTGGAQDTAASVMPARGGTGTVVAHAGVLMSAFGAHLEGVTLREALTAITAKTGVPFTYSASDIRLGARVSLVADRITVGDALAILLAGTGCEAVVSETGRRIVLERTSTELAPHVTMRQQGTGTVTGRVTDAKAGQPMSDVVVSLRGTAFHTQTTLDGSFILRNVQAASYTALFQRLGYTLAAREISVTPDSTVRLVVGLQPSATILDEVVTTVTGDVTERTLGTEMPIISVADSVVGKAPVTSLTDIISARVPGVQVFADGGLTGASPNINIRGQNSAFLSNEPLLVIDGVRVENSTASAKDFTQQTAAGRFNDLVAEDIETIQIVRGPSAATLYGTDAANGVILVTTKRGVGGRRSWNLWAEQGLLAAADPSRIPASYYPWGHTTDGTNTRAECTLAPYFGGPSLGGHTCVQDSVTHFSPLRVASATPYGQGNRWNYGAQVSGGGNAIRYFLSGTASSETGYLQLPPDERHALAVQRGQAGLSDQDTKPNAQRKASGRANFVLPLGSTADVALSSSVITQSTRIPASSVIQYGLFGTGYRDSVNDGWNSGIKPLYSFVVHDPSNNTHLIASAAPTWRPLSWLTARATMGIDFSSDEENASLRYGEASPNGNSHGEIRTGSTNADVYTADLGATASSHVLSLVSLRTSVGAQYTRNDSRSVTLNLDLPYAGCNVASCGVSQGGLDVRNQTAVAGGYVEQMIGLADQLFLTGAVRADGGSSFGSRLQTQAYPKLSASWLASEVPFLRHASWLNTLRLRAAYGSAGIQPPPSAKLDIETINQVYVDGTTLPGAGLPAYGNPLVKPERTTEVEAGFDVDVFADRLHLQGTYYVKRSANALTTIPLASSIGSGSELINLGAVRNRGIEALFSADVFRSKPITWNLTLSGSVNHNTLLTLGPYYTAQRVTTTGATALVPGFPMYSYFAYPILGFADRNHDGLIESDEVTVGSSPVYVGPSNPATQVTTASQLSLFGGKLQLRIQLDYRGGFRIFNYDVYQQCVSWGACREIADVHTSLANQARYVATTTQSLHYTGWGYLEDGAFTRLRELALTYEIPFRFVKQVGVRNASITVAGCNLALWTKYTGPDPEAAGSENPTGGTPATSAYFDNGGIVPTRLWMIRLNLGL